MGYRKKSNTKKYVYNDIFNFIQIAGLLNSWMASKIDCKT